MVNYEIFNVLRTFSKAELNRFGKFLGSPYFGDRKKLLVLYREIMKCHPLYTDIGLSRKLLAKKLFPKEKLKDSTMRNLFSDLHQAALNFLQVEGFELSNLLKSNFLFSQLKIKNLKEEFYEIAAKDEFFTDEKVDWAYFLNRHFTETNKYNFSYHNKRLQKGSTIDEEISYVNNSVINLVYFFITELISRYMNLLMYKITYNVEEIKTSIEPVFRLIDLAKLKSSLNNDKNIFILDIYTALLKAYSDFDNEENYYSYKKIVNENINRLSKDEISFHYFQLIAYCSTKIFYGNTKNNFDIELFLLYKEMLEGSYYLDMNSKYLQPELFRNILLHGLRLKEFGWVNDFIVSHSPKVHPNDKYNILNYGLAYLNFNTGNYEKAQNYVNKIEQSFFVFKVDIKHLMLMIYYELGYTEEGLSLIKSYREFIRKDKLLNRVRQKHYHNFAKCLERLTLSRAGTIKTDPSLIKRKLMKNNMVAFKDWLLEKIDRLEARHKKAM